MTAQFPAEGGICRELADKVHRLWQEAAAKNQIDLRGFDAHASYEKRCNWAIGLGLIIATVYSRFSSKMQHSTDDQVRECVVWAARNGMYVPPELICIDEATKGKSVRRQGLDRVKSILGSRAALAFLVFKASRLFRHAYKGFQFIQEEVVEAGLRAVSVSQGIDTADEKAWKIQLQVHNLMDDLLLDAIADHVRSGQVGLHINGWVTGALGIGYRRKELPNAPRTNRGLVRTVPEVDPTAAKLIQEHAQLLLEGMRLNEGLRRWRAADGPCDPRSTTGQMSYNAYRRLWTNIRLIGRWEFGRKRNRFSTKRDRVEQIVQPDSEVSVCQREDLRILDDATFYALQEMLQKQDKGPRGPRKEKPVRLWDLTTELFFCAACSQPDALVRMYQSGANGKGMRCKHGDFCERNSTVRRDDAVRAVCSKLADLVERDAALIEQVVSCSEDLDNHAEDQLRSEIKSSEERVRSLTQRIDRLMDMLGAVSNEDVPEMKAKIRTAQSERSQLQQATKRLQSQLDGTVSTLTPEAVRQALSETTDILQAASTGELGEDAVYTALAIVRRLTGGRIMVHVEQRPGRQRSNVRGVFTPQLLNVIEEAPAGDPTKGSQLSMSELSVWLRQPPRMDLIAERVHELVDIQKLSLRDAAKQLRLEGHDVNSGNVWYSHQRYWEMRGESRPELPYNNGHPRESRE